jgi:hypothetical protein
MLMHAPVNNTKDVVPSAATPGHHPFTLAASPMAWLTAILLWTCGAYFLVRMRQVRVVGSAPANVFDELRP